MPKSIRLSKTQKQALVRLLDPFWKFPKDGRKAHGLGQTLWSLKRKGLVNWLAHGEEGTWLGMEVTGPGWILTSEGEERARALRAEGVTAW